MKYQIGDEVLVKDWEVMEKEFGVEWTGDIPCGMYLFTKEKKKYCGKIVTIKNVFNGCGCYGTEEVCWGWTDEMFVNNVGLEVVCRVNGEEFPLNVISEKILWDMKRGGEADKEISETKVELESFQELVTALERKMCLLYDKNKEETWKERS